MFKIKEVREEFIQIHDSEYYTREEAEKQIERYKKVDKKNWIEIQYEVMEA